MIALCCNQRKQRGVLLAWRDLTPTLGWLNSHSHSLRLTFELQPDEVAVAQVLQEDAVGRAGLKVEGDVGAGLGLEGGEVQVGGRRGEGRSVPVVTCGENNELRGKI